MISLKDVRFEYRNNQSKDASCIGRVKDVNLTVAPGELILLCGTSGCGKTTITRMINGLIPHYYEGEISGSINVAGIDVFNEPIYETALKIGSVFQNPRSQFFTIDTMSELAFASENQGLPEKEIISRIQTTVADFQLESLMNKNIFHLSGGEKQRIACASVSVANPIIMVLDEPSSNLDHQTIQDLRDMIVKWKEKGKTVVIAEHRLYFLRDLIDQMVYMEKGKIKEVYCKAQVNSFSDQELREMGLRPFHLPTLQKRNKVVDAVDVQPDGLLKEKEIKWAEDDAADNNEKGVIIFDHFYFSYRKNKVLDIEQLAIPKNQIIALVGRNGSGKTTFARTLCGFEKKFKGRVWWNEKCYSSKKIAKQCYMVLQDVNHQLFTDSVLEEVLISMQSPSSEKAKDILKKLGLLDLQEMHPMALSGGQKQRVAIASAIASERPILIFDEPTSGLDLEHMHQVSESLKKLKAIGKSILVITHDHELINDCCDYVVQMRNGTVESQFPLK